MLVFNGGAVCHFVAFSCICGKIFAIFAPSKVKKHFWHTFGYINNVPQGGVNVKLLNLLKYYEH